MSRILELPICLLFLSLVIVSASEYKIKLEASSKSSVVHNQFNFTATLFYRDKVAKSDSYNYKWLDTDGNVLNQTESNQPSSNFSITYNKEGGYKIKLVAEKVTSFFNYRIADAEVKIYVSDMLGGKLDYIQNQTKRDNDYISTTLPVNHSISLRQSDMDFLKEKASYVTVYWFENCVYIGKSNDFYFVKHYHEPDMEYEIEALIIASFEPLPEPTTTTTTTTTTSTTPSTTTSTSTSSTTPPPTTTPSTTAAPTTATTKKASARKRRDAGKDESSVHVILNGKNLDVEQVIKHIESGNLTDHEMKELLNSEIVEKKVSPPPPPTKNILLSPLFKEEFDEHQPFVCFNKSNVAPDSKKTYGYFKRKIVTKVPINNISVTGRTWLQIGEYLHLNYSFQGSFPVTQCVSIYTDKPLNTTDLKCNGPWINMTSNWDTFGRYYNVKHTIIFFFQNPLGVSFSQVAVNFYEAQKQSQLSVIIVPVSFILVAVILVVFGFAYYVESRNRYTVEVADFNFGETQSVDMEYKTFTRRLLDSIRDLVPNRYVQQYDDGGDFPPSPSGSIAGNVAESSLPYGPMS